MARAAAKHITTEPALDPVVELSRELLRIWDADEGWGLAFRDKVVTPSARNDATVQFSDLRNAVETLISFRAASGVEGALVQLALAIDTANGISSSRDDENEINDIELKLHRLIRSAMDAMLSTLRTNIDPTVWSIVRIYAGNPVKMVKWIDLIDDWAEKGRSVREKEED